jgi:hydrogenase small subunit
VGGICMACTMPGFPDKYMPFMDADPWGTADTWVMKYTYGPIVRFFRDRHMKQFEEEPEWRHNKAELTTGYSKRW